MRNGGECELDYKFIILQSDSSFENPPDWIRTLLLDNMMGGPKTQTLCNNSLS